MGSICIIAQVAGFYFKKHPIEVADEEEVVAAEILRERISDPENVTSKQIEG
jgi:hypothetical protein